MKSQKPIAAPDAQRGHVTSLPWHVSSEIKEGRSLAGDDFTAEQLQTWFAQEQEAFFEHDSGNGDVDPWYGYMRFVNEILGFSQVELRERDAGSILVLGPGSGIEIERFARSNPRWSLHFLEASDNFKKELARKWPRSVLLQPQTSGEIALERESQDIVCAFSVLHHVPNVTRVIGEIARVLKHGGYLLTREPCSSMGDWRYPRSATPNERGISRQLLVEIAAGAGLEVAIKPIPILFEPINKVLKRTVGFSLVPFGLLYGFDRLISHLLSCNDHYWRDTWFKKFGPSSYFYIFRKLSAASQGK